VSNKTSRKERGLNKPEYRLDDFMLTKIPWPTRSVWVAVVFFCVLWGLRERYLVPRFELCIERKADFLLLRQAEPEVLIGGSSMNGLATSTEELQRRLRRPVAKITLTDGSPWECLCVMKKYAVECRNVNLLVLDLAPGRLKFVPETESYRKNRFLMFHQGGERRIPANAIQPTFDEQVFPLRLSLEDLKRIRLASNSTVMESMWDARVPVAQNPQLLAELRKKENKARQDRSLPTPKWTSATSIPPIHEEMVAVVFELVEYCRERNIRIVFNVAPLWYGSEAVPPPTLADPNARAYWKLLDRLAEFPHCSVITVGSLEEIVPDCDYGECYGDAAHMTRKGAKLYTNWLADRILETSPHLAGTPANHRF